MYYLHVGAKPKQLASVLKIVKFLGNRFYIDGDGWETWGEALGTDRNDKKTLHISIAVASTWEARLVAKLLMGETTVSKYDGHYAVLSDHDDWGAFDGVEGLVRSFQIPQVPLNQTDLRLSTEFDHYAR